MVCNLFSSEVEKAVKDLRETYIATLKHDIKTPIISQILVLDLLLKEQIGALNKEQRELLLLTKASCVFVSEILSTLLNTYEYENGNYTLNIEQCNIFSLVEETVNDLESMLKEKNVTINISKAGEIYTTDCDRMQIKRVIKNILRNSISCAYNNTPIAITIKQDKNAICFETKNESPYINQETMNNLFKKCVSHVTKLDKIGVGLGLYLSKKIIDTHNGIMFAESYKDNHNLFGFILPIVNNKQT